MGVVDRHRPRSRCSVSQRRSRAHCCTGVCVAGSVLANSSAARTSSHSRHTAARGGRGSMLPRPRGSGARPSASIAAAPPLRHPPRSCPAGRPAAAQHPEAARRLRGAHERASTSGQRGAPQGRPATPRSFSGVFYFSGNQRPKILACPGLYHDALAILTGSLVGPLKVTSQPSGFQTFDQPIKSHLPAAPHRNVRNEENFPRRKSLRVNGSAGQPVR